MKLENAICEMAAILSRWNELNSFRSRQRIWKCRLQNRGLLFRLYCVNATLLSLFDIVAGCAFDCEILLSLAQTNAYRRANMPYDKGHIVMQWPRSFGQLLTFPIRLKNGWPAVLPIIVTIKQFNLHAKNIKLSLWSLERMWRKRTLASRPL